jgi:hypothetical protein
MIIILGVLLLIVLAYVVFGLICVYIVYRRMVRRVVNDSRMSFQTPVVTKEDKP